MVLSAKETQMLVGGSPSQEAVLYFRNKYGDRFVRALRAVEEGRVTKYVFHPSNTSTWIVKGRRRDYMVIPDVYCSCRSFYQDVVIAHSMDFCYHLLAQEIAQLWGHYKIIDQSDRERRTLYIQWRRTD
ncbi:MAG: hypothetical protein K9W43_00195 [Candidatus Thorarchaeota archaeon]|nr:hypothetical protein [Candidatus Thorarchaeota archaeon]